MKTIQETIKELDKERLINHYLYKYPIQFETLKDEDRTVKQIKQRAHDRLSEYIDRLASLEIIEPEDGKHGLVFVHRFLEDGFDEPIFEMVVLEELLELGTAAQNYGIEFTKQEEILGYFVADSVYTQQNIYDLMAAVMFEASFFGFEQESLEQELADLDRSIKEIEEGTAKTYTHEEVMEFFEKEFGFERERDPETEEEEEKKREINMASYEYSQMTRKRELENILKLLEEEKGDI